MVSPSLPFLPWSGSPFLGFKTTHRSLLGWTGPRVAAYYGDALTAAGIKADVSEAVVLTGGIKRWVELYGEEDKVTCKL